MKTFDSVVNDMQGMVNDNQSEWLSLITAYYLTEKDTLTLDAMRTNCEAADFGKSYSQRELSIIYTVPQWILSRRIRKVRTKVYTLYTLLSCDGLAEEFATAKSQLTEKQYTFLGYILAGNRMSEIAKHLGVSKYSTSTAFKIVIHKLNRGTNFKNLSKLAKYVGKGMWATSGVDVA